MKICLGYFDEGATCEVYVPDLQGNTKATIKAKRTNDVLELFVEWEENFTYEVLGNQNLEVNIKQG